MVINIMERIIRESLKEKIKNYPDMCFCDKCLDDIVALALNRIQPKYVATATGETIARSVKILQQQSRMDTDVAILQAINTVRENPRHKGGWN